ncbi:unnamed protein product, partial [Amoebophrya sp. A25]|eukprot:GSA25T00000237001.1
MNEDDEEQSPTYQGEASPGDGYGVLLFHEAPSEGEDDDMTPTPTADHGAPSEKIEDHNAPEDDCRDEIKRDEEDADEDEGHEEEGNASFRRGKNTVDGPALLHHGEDRAEGESRAVTSSVQKMTHNGVGGDGEQDASALAPNVVSSGSEALPAESARSYEEHDASTTKVQNRQPQATKVSPRAGVGEAVSGRADGGTRTKSEKDTEVQKNENKDPHEVEIEQEERANAIGEENVVVPVGIPSSAAPGSISRSTSSSGTGACASGNQLARALTALSSAEAALDTANGRIARLERENSDLRSQVELLQEEGALLKQRFLESTPPQKVKKRVEFGVQTASPIEELLAKATTLLQADEQDGHAFRELGSRVDKAIDARTLTKASHQDSTSKLREEGTIEPSAAVTGSPPSNDTQASGGPSSTFSSVMASTGNLLTGSSAATSSSSSPSSEAKLATARAAFLEEMLTSDCVTSTSSSSTSSMKHQLGKEDFELEAATT